jgi:ribonucleoside-triphosphate reductase (thioredoxin)
MWVNKASYNGLSVLPCGNGNYSRPDFRGTLKEDFHRLVKSLRSTDFSMVFKPDDTTDLHAEAACSGGACSIV